MELWSGILLSMTALSVTVGLCRLLWDTKTYEPQLRFAVSVVSLLLLLTPLLSYDWQGYLPDLPDTTMDREEAQAQAAWRAALLAESERTLTKTAETVLQQRFGLSKGEWHLSLDLTLSQETVLLRSATLYLASHNAYMQPQIEGCLADQLCTQVNVILE